MTGDARHGPETAAAPLYGDAEAAAASGLALPSLRVMLGLETLAGSALTWVFFSVLLSWGVAEAFSRIAWARGHKRTEQAK